jgi:hypothetical protein
MGAAADLKRVPPGLLGESKSIEKLVKNELI